VRAAQGPIPRLYRDAFRQSMEDGATVPLFYEKRVPEMLFQN
jgi:hypothetical protein